VNKPRKRQLKSAAHAGKGDPDTQGSSSGRSRPRPSSSSKQLNSGGSNSSGSIGSSASGCNSSSGRYGGSSRNIDEVSSSGASQQHKPQHSKSRPPRHAAADSNRSNIIKQSKQRTKDIQAAQTPQLLLHLLQQHAADLDHINISAACTSTVQLCSSRGVPPQQQSAAMQQLLRHLHQLAETQQQQCGARQLANIMWSCGRLRCPATVQLLLPELLQSGKLQLAEPQEVSNTLWAAATLGVQLAEGDVQQLVQHFAQVLPKAKPQEVSNTLWAATTLGVQLADGDLQQLVMHLTQVLPDAKPQAVSNTLLAVATMGLQVPAHQLDEMLTHLQAQLPRCKPQLANSVWACGRMQYAPLQLLAALEQQPVDLKAFLAAEVLQGLANMAWACGQLGYRGKLLPGMLLQQAVQLLQDSKTCSNLNMPSLCNLCWCAAVLDLQQYVPQVLQLAAACKHMWGTAVGEDFRQLYHVHLWLLDSQLPAPGQGLLGVLSKQQLQQCKDSWEQHTCVKCCTSCCTSASDTCSLLDCRSSGSSSWTVAG
jgi:hypothetical protein